MTETSHQDYFGDEPLFDRSRRETITLQKVFGDRASDYLETSRCHGKRFADRLLEDAAHAFGPGGRRVHLHFPVDIESINCFAVEARPATLPMAWRYNFEVVNKGIDGETVGDEKPKSFVTTLTAHQLGRIFSAYDSSDPIYQQMLGSSDELYKFEQRNLLTGVMNKARSTAPGQKNDL